MDIVLQNVIPEVPLKNSAAGVSWHDSAYSSQRSLELHRLCPQSARCLEEEREQCERQFLHVGSRWHHMSNKVQHRVRDMYSMDLVSVGVSCTVMFTRKNSMQRDTL